VYKDYFTLGKFSKKCTDENNKQKLIDKLKEYLRETNIELYNKLIMQTNNKRFNLLF